jgi:hypothetical protein
LRPERRRFHVASVERDQSRCSGRTLTIGRPFQPFPERAATMALPQLRVPPKTEQQGDQPAAPLAMAAE